jgi:hypothetical protein
MKLRFATLSALAAMFVTGVIGLSGCHPNEKIPFDEVKAREHIIPAGQGEEYIHSFQRARVALGRQVRDSLFLDSAFQLPVAESFNRDAIISLLNADSAVGIRMYLGRDSTGLIRFVLAPINKYNQDILTKLVTSPTDGNGAKPEELKAIKQLVEIGQRCPTVCDSPSTSN